MKLNKGDVFRRGAYAVLRPQGQPRYNWLGLFAELRHGGDRVRATLDDGSVIEAVLTVDSKGNVWFGSPEGALTMIFGQGGIREEITEVEIIEPAQRDPVWKDARVVIDRAGDVWQRHPNADEWRCGWTYSNQLTAVDLDRQFGPCCEMVAKDCDE